MSTMSRTWTNTSVGIVVEIVRTFVRFGGKEAVFAVSKFGLVRFADRRRWRAVAVRTARGLVWEVGVRIVRRKVGCGVGRDCAVSDVVREARVGGFAILIVGWEVIVIEDIQV